MKSKLPWILILVMCGVSQVIAQAPAWQWASEANSPGPERAWDVAYDTFSGNLFVGGSFNGNLGAVYGPMLSSTFGQSDAFLAKYNAQGSVLWAIKIGGSDMEEIKGVATDGSGNVYVTGYFKSNCDFDPGPASYNLTPNGGIGSQDGFLAKYNSMGALQWATKFGGSGADDAWRLYADANGVYLTGTYVGSATFNSAAPSVVTKTTTGSQGFNEFYGAKYNPAGVVQWVISGSSQKDDVGYDIVADASNVYFIGTYEKDMNLYNANGSFTTQLQVANNNNTSIFILAYSQAGALSWATNAGAANNDAVGNGITQDNTSLYIIGSIEGTTSFPLSSPLFSKGSSGNSDMFLAKLSKSNGTYQWVSSQTCTGGGDEVGYETEVDAAGNVIVAGYFSSNITFTAGPVSFSTLGNEDVLVSAYSPAGAFLWATKAGGNNPDIPYGLATNTTGGVYVAGVHANAAVFGAYTLTNASNENIFVAKTGCETALNNTIAAAQTICAGNTPVALSGSLPTGGSFYYAWEQSLNSNTWTAAVSTNTSQNYSPPALSASTYYRRKVFAGLACSNASTSNTISITVNQVPSIAAAGSAQTLCISAPVTTLSGNVPAVGTGSWSIVSGSAGIATPTLATSAVNGLALGLNVLKWTISNPPCAASSQTVGIKVDNVPTTPVAGAAQTICISASSVALSGNTLAVGSGSWSVASGAIVLSPTLAAATLTNLTTGTITAIWTSSNGACSALSSSTTIRVDALPTVANAGSNQTLCISAPNTTLSGNVPAVGTGSWSLVSGSGSIATPTLATSPVNALTTGTNVLKWSIKNGVCAASNQTVGIQVDNMPTTPVAGASQTICISASSVALSGNTLAVGSGSWSVASGATVLSPTLAAATLTNLTTGTITAVWTSNNGVCATLSSSTTLQVDALPSVANAGSNQTLCISLPSTTLGGNVPAIGTGSWSVLSGSAGITTPTLATSLITALNTGTNVLNWNIKNGVCAASNQTVSIQVDNLPSTPIAGAAQTICISASSVTLSGNVPTVGTGSWSVVNGAATLVSPALANATVVAAMPGVVALAWTTSNGVCAPRSDTTYIQVDDVPTTANAGASQSICINTASTVLNGNLPTLGSGLWSFISGSGNVSNPSAPAGLVTSLPAGLNVLQWAISNGVCAPSTSTVSVQVDALPSAAFAGNDYTVCATSASLQANQPSNGIGNWLVLNGGSAANSQSNITTVSNLPAGNNQFVWQVSNGACPPSLDTLLIKVDALPAQPFAGADQHVCSTAATLAAQQPLQGNSWWSLLQGNAVLNDSLSHNSSISINDTGVVLLRWHVKNGICAVVFDDVLVNRDAPPDTVNAGPDASTEKPFIQLNAVAPAIGHGQWEVVQGTGIVANVQEAFTTADHLSDGNNIFKWTVKNGVCDAKSDDVVIYVEPLALPTGFSPNGDGINDTYVIPGIDYYEQAELWVYNRWGAEIYYNAAYKNEWAGTNKSNEPLADDTYYYTLKVGGKKDYKGYIIIKTTK